MLPEKLLYLLFCIAVAIQTWLMLQLLDTGFPDIGAPVWVFIHVVVNAVSAVCTVRLIALSDKRIRQLIALFSFVVVTSIFMPLIGSVGILLSTMYSLKARRLRHREPDHWKLTPLAPLPYAPPKKRSVSRVDGRGFVEHLMYSSDEHDLYRKVLSAANIKASLSVNALKQAMRHSDEHIRLSAFKTLDRKVTQLNQQIQHLEAQVSDVDHHESSNIWLQIADNYWELLKLEDSASVASRELLEKAENAAIQAVAILADNRNAHYVLGRISLMQGKTQRASIAFERAATLGMPTDKIAPYLAETAFVQRDYADVVRQLGKLDPATRTYPPLSHVVEYWT